MAKSKTVKTVKATLLVLKGFNPTPKRGESSELEALFTVNEKELALAVAESWDKKGWKPWLFSKTYDGDFRTLYNYETRAKAAKSKAKKAA